MNTVRSCSLTLITIQVIDNRKNPSCHHWHSRRSKNFRFILRISAYLSTDQCKWRAIARPTQPPSPLSGYCLRLPRDVVYHREIPPPQLISPNTRMVPEQYFHVRTQGTTPLTSAFSPRFTSFWLSDNRHALHSITGAVRDHTCVHVIRS